MPVTVLLILSLIAGIGSNSIIIFKDNHFKGRNQTIDVTSCVSPLPNNFDNKISSIDVKKQCVNLYADEECLGDYITLQPGIPGNNDLRIWEFNDQVSSIGTCDDLCSPRNIEIRPENVSTTITLYDHSDYLGAHANIDVKGCTNIPRKLKGRVSSVQTQDNVCIEFYEHGDCTGISIPLRRGSPFHSNFGQWGLLNDNAKAVSLCGYNCYRKAIVKSKLRNLLQPDLYVVTVFDELDRNGNSKPLQLSEGCIDLKGEWDGESRSIETFGECVFIYSLYECPKSAEYPPLTFNVLNNNNYNNTWANFPSKWSVRSIKSCQDLSKFNIARNTTASETERTNWVQLATFGIIGLVLVGLGAVVSVIVFRLRLRKVIEGLSLKEIQDFRNGIYNGYNDGREGAMESVDGPEHGQPYEEKFEIPKNCITIETGFPLGSGAFAVVYKGQIKCINRSEDVAVKMVKPYSSVEYTRALLKEIKTMIHVGYHVRIVRLVGCYTQDLQHGELYIMSELCKNGSLETFLRNNADSFVNLLENGELSLNKLEYLQFKNQRHYGAITPIISSNFNTIHLMQWSLDIAEGMDYLVYKKVIHGDLAARNILLDSDFNIKISDFGLSKQLYQYSQYVKKSNSPLPWRWLAIETLKTLSFSTESDIWAFGVTVWEIFSLGSIPFADRAWNEDFVTSLSEGLRLPNPKNGTVNWFAVISDCWKEKPSERITFRDIRIKLSKILTEYLPSNPNMTDPYLEIIDIHT